MPSYGAEKLEPEEHYVIHVRVEKVTRYVNKATTIIGSTETQGREVDEVVNVIRKSVSLPSAIVFIKGTLDLVDGQENPNKKAVDA